MLEAKQIIIVSALVVGLTSCTSAGRKSEERPARIATPDIRDSEEGRTNNETVISGKLDRLIEKYWGADYQLGKEGPGSFDCSGFIRRIFSEAYSFNLPRVSKDQYQIGKPVAKTSLEYADLVFFSTNSQHTVSHVGVYIGNGKFAHASTSVGVTITALESDYYRDRYLGARRVLK